VKASAEGLFDRQLGVLLPIILLSGPAGFHFLPAIIAEPQILVAAGVMSMVICWAEMLAVCAMHGVRCVDRQRDSAVYDVLTDRGTSLQLGRDMQRDYVLRVACLHLADDECEYGRQQCCNGSQHKYAA